MYSAILVTGCGGDIGLSIGKVLRNAGIAGKIIGCDIHKHHEGTFFFDEFEVVEKLRSKKYFLSMQQVAEKYKVDLIIPSTEIELRYFVDHKIDNINGIKLLFTANISEMRIGFDKLKTIDFFREKKIPYPETIIAKECQEMNLPCILKDRFGAGSSNVFKVSSDNFLELKKQYPDYIFQKLLLPNNEEYTCCVFRMNHDVRTIVLKRDLRYGITNYGELIENLEIEKFVETIAEEMDLTGAINIQLRLTEDGPRVFEINPRFSSTVFFRHLLGFQDLVWRLMIEKNRALPCFVKPGKNIKIFRGQQEFVAMGNEIFVVKTENCSFEKFKLQEE